MKGDHPAAGRFPSLVGVEAAVDRVATCEEWTKPRGVGTNARRRDADTLLSRTCSLLCQQLEAADRIDGGFTEDDPFGVSMADPEVAGVSAGTGCKASPDAISAAPQFGTDGTIWFSSHHQKHRISATIGVQLAFVDQRREDLYAETPLLVKVATHLREVCRA